MGFGIKKEAGSNTTPSQIVNFDKLTPTTAGVVFTPNTPATLDVLYLSSVDASTWIWNGTAYVTYTNLTASTEWYLLGTTIDAGSNKTAAISRDNSIYTVGYDSYFNSVRVGRGNNNISTNTVVGTGAGGAISTGSDNSFFGANSGIFNSSGNYNSFFGTYAGYSNTFANSNTFIGNSAGYNFTTGGGNVSIGYLAGKFYGNLNLPLTTGSNSVYIGNQATALVNGSSNEIVIGSQAMGKGANTVNIGNTSITNTYLNGAVTFNNAFTFPTTDGTANYFLKTNGSGTVTWGASAGGLTYFTEAQNTTAPNATVPVDSLTAVTGTTNGDFAIIPKGSGAILAQIPDDTITGGGKRGANALDLQMGRTNASNTASGQYSVVLGYNCKASATNAIAIGTASYATGVRAIALGSNAFSSGIGSCAIGGNGGTITSSGDGSFAVGGVNTTASASGAVAMGCGFASAENSFAMGFSAATGTNSVAMGGQSGGANGSGASGNGSFSMGMGCTADARNSSAFGVYASSKGVAQRLSIGTFQDLAPYLKGSAQLSLSASVATTTTNTAVELVAYSGTAINLVLQANEAIRVKGSIIGKQSATTNVTSYDFDCVIVRGTTAASTVIKVSNMNLVWDDIICTVLPTLTADTTNGGLSVKSGAKTTTTIKWSCRIDSTEVILA